MLSSTRPLFAIAIAAFLVACSDGGPDATKPPSTDNVDSGELADAGGADAAPTDAAVAMIDAHDARDAGDAANDAGNTCEVFGAPGSCMSVSACAALPDHSSFSGQCPGPSSVECCIDTPDTADNPPIPTGYKLMSQSQVTPAMTTWAVDILHDPITYPMFSTTTQTFGTLMVLARVEWHPPDFQNSVVHRGVTLYEPI
jgi:hypothetical protein